MHEIKVGDSIMVEGHEYVIVSYDMKVASNGRSCSLTSLDPMLAETERMKDEEYRQSERDRQEMLKQSIKHMADHNHEEE